MNLATHHRPATEITDLDPAGPVYRERAYFLSDFAARWGGVVIDPAPDLEDRALYQAHPTHGLPMSWHINRERDLDDLFGHVRRVGLDDPLAEYDGHTTAAKYARMRGLHQGLPGAPRPVVGERRLYRDGRATCGSPPTTPPATSARSPPNTRPSATRRRRRSSTGPAG